MRIRHGIGNGNGKLNLVKEVVLYHLYKGERYIHKVIEYADILTR